MDQELYDEIQRVQHASLFRSNASGKSRIVDKPFLGGPIASAFERLSRFEDSTLEVGRLGLHEVHDVCCGLDAVADGFDGFDLLSKWKLDGSIMVRRMSGGRC